MLATFSAEPCTSPLTVPELVFLHQPASPSRSACSAVFARKNTPCTLRVPSVLCASTHDLSQTLTLQESLNSMLGSVKLR